MVRLGECLEPVSRAARRWQEAAAESARLEVEYRDKLAELSARQRSAAEEVARFAAPADPRLYTPEEVAELLRLSRTRVYGLLASRALRSVRIGTLRRIPASQLQAYIDGLLDTSEGGTASGEGA